MPDDKSPIPSDNLIGQELGQYKITKKLGRGGMASVYLADQASIGRQVAVKVMPRHFLHDPSFLERFQREVKVIANLQHPRVLPVYDYGQVDDSPYIVMAYMPGGTLADKIEKGGMTLREIAKVIRQVAEGLDHAHRKGIIHRDFKPSNVLMSEYGDAVLADFGIAKMSESTVNLTGSGVIGTPSYMAPEMAERGEVTTAVDIYALGVTLYEALTGSAPFQGETPLSVMMAHATRPVPDLRLTRPDVPTAVADVVNKAMSKNPNDRYKSATEMAKALDDAIAGNTSSVKAPPKTEPLLEAAPAPMSAPVPANSSVAQIGSQAALSSTNAEQPKKSGFLRVFGGLGIGALAIIGLCAVISVAGIILLFLLPTSSGGDPVSGNNSGFAANVYGGGGAELNVVNSSVQEICGVYFRQPGTNLDEWSENVLGDTFTIAPGSSLLSAEIPAGTHWFRAEFCESNLYNAYDFDVAVASGEAHDFVVDGAAETTLTIINQTSLEVCFIFVVPPGDALRGDHFGQSQSLPSAQQIALQFPSGTYDLRATTCDQNTTWDLPNTTLTSTFEWTLTE